MVYAQAEPGDGEGWVLVAALFVGFDGTLLFVRYRPEGAHVEVEEGAGDCVAADAEEAGVFEEGFGDSVVDGEEDGVGPEVDCFLLGDEGCEVG